MTEEITDARNFNLAFKFRPKWGSGVQLEILHF